MRERSKGDSLELAGAKAGMCRQTAAKYDKGGKLPSDEPKSARFWRTRSNPFEDVWADVVTILKDAPGVQAKLIFEMLQREHPGCFPDGQLRTLQRQVKRWRGMHGDDAAHEVFFPQAHRPGEAMQTDFTYTGELNLTVGGDAYAPLLCQSVLPYSGWRSVTVTSSESTLALIKGVHDALFRLGAVPEWHQTDNSTGATHRVGSGARDFNDDYVAAMDHFGMKPRTIAVGKKEQNGSVEAHNGALKRLLEQHLRLRGDRDFESKEAFGTWLHGIVEESNGPRRAKVAEEHVTMKALPAGRLRTFKELRTRVTRNATVRVKDRSYSLPPRLMGHQVDIRVYEERVEFYFAGELVQERPRLLGKERFDIDYRHIIWSLVRKPGAMARYVYRECLFPTLTFRRAYEALQTDRPGTAGDAEYLRLLHLAASTMEAEVEAALCLLMDAGRLPDAVRVRELVDASPEPVPHLDTREVELSEFDQLLSGGAS